MTRRRLAALLLAASLPTAAGAQPQPGEQALHLQRIVLSQGGVGYFEYAAHVDGGAALGLDLPRDAVSDVLASLVVLDAAGSVDAADLPSENPQAPALAALPVPVEALNDPTLLLNALQGVDVSVGGATPISGRIVHAVAEPAVGAPGTTPIPARTRVTLLTEAGLQQFILEDVSAVQIVDPDLRARFAAALAALRGSAAADRRHLRLLVQGAGGRDVHVGIVIGAPLWKASYRLVLPGGTDDRARLQGWAVLENAGLQDWSDVALTLQAGNPVSLRQDLYQTYYVDRPSVPVDMQQHPAPPVDFSNMPPPPASAMSAPMGMRAMMMMPTPLAAPAEATQVVQGVAQSAYTMARPFSLAAGHSAAVPFVDASIAAARVDLLASNAEHPYAAVTLTNGTGQALPQGLVTTYDPTGFSGDALLRALPAGQDRVLTFAQDNAVSAQWQHSSRSDIVGVTAARGVLQISRRRRDRTTIDLQAPADHAVTLLVEVPRPAGATLATLPDLPATQTATAWRLKVMLAAGEQRRVVADADRVLSSTTEVGTDPDTLGVILSDTALPAAARTALQHVAELQQALADRRADETRLRTERDRIEADETRLRANLSAVPRTDALHGSLLRGLAANEDRLSALATQASQAADATRAAQQALVSAIADLAI